MPGIESILSITLKPLLIMGFVYFVWHRFVVRNDSVRALNMAILSFVLSLFAYGILYVKEKASAAKQVDEFQTVAVENLQSLQKINTKIGTFEKELSAIDEKFNNIQKETKSLYEKLVTKKISNVESEKRRKILLSDINTLEDQIKNFYTHHDSVVRSYSYIVFPNDTSSNLNSVFINKINKLIRSYVFNPSNLTEEIHKSLTNVQQNEESLYSELAANDHRMHSAANRIANLRRELIGDVNILYISPDISK